MPIWTEESMQNALQVVENGMSRKGAAKEYKIPLSTLRDRLNGATTIKQNAIDRQALSEIQGNQLAHWILVQEVLGTPTTHFQVRRATEEILRTSGTEKKLGKNWVIKFMERNPKIDTREGKKL